MFKIFVINPGSTSTKIALFQGTDEQFSHTVHHDSKSLSQFGSIIEQQDFRIESIQKALAENNIHLDATSAVVARGGLLRPIPSGTYLVDENMLADLRAGRYGEHASNLGAIIAKYFSDLYHTPAYIVDPVVVDEMHDLARATGHPAIVRKSIFHALNHKAVARKAASKLNKDYDLLNLIVAHIGGGISVGAHKAGKVIDVNNALDGEGPFSPERAGTLPAGDLVRLCFSGKFSESEMLDSLRGKGGLVALLGTNSLQEVYEKIVNDNDQIAKTIYETMAYQIAKSIGSMAVVLKGKVDAIILTGGITFDSHFVNLIADFITFLAPIITIPGEEEMQALAGGALRILRGDEAVKLYQEQTALV